MPYTLHPLQSSLSTSTAFLLPKPKLFLIFSDLSAESWICDHPSQRPEMSQDRHEERLRYNSLRSPWVLSSAHKSHSTSGWWWSCLSLAQTSDQSLLQSLYLTWPLMLPPISMLPIQPRNMVSSFRAKYQGCQMCCFIYTRYPSCTQSYLFENRVLLCSPRLASNLKSSCLSLSSAGITGVHYTWLPLTILEAPLSTHFPEPDTWATPDLRSLPQANFLFLHFDSSPILRSQGWGSMAGAMY
jgi:hypothetical protein